MCTKNIPTLRFPEFDGEWEEKRIGDLFSEFRSGNNITSSSISEEGNYPVYGGNGLRGFTDTYTHDGFYLLIGRQGALCGNVNRTNGKSYISEHAIAGMANETSNTEWLAQRLDYYNLNRLSESSAQPGLSVSKLLRFKLIVPSLPEQTKIAEFLTAIDQKLLSIKKKKTLLEDYKKGVMQQLFSQQIRFKDDNGLEYPEWEKKKLGEVFTSKQTNSLSRENLNYHSGDVKNIHYGDIHTKFSVLFDIDKENVPYINSDVDISRAKDDSYCLEGDIVLADASEDYADIGKSIEIVNLGKQKTLAGLHTILARPKSNILAKGFAGFMMQSNQIRLQIMKEAQGTKVLGISSSRLSNIDLHLPVIPEQTKIANFLSAIDDKIKATQIQIEGMEQYKKGLLQKMFV